MNALITDGKNTGRVMRLSESEIDLSDVLEKDEKTGAYRMTEADANWVRNTLREGTPKNDGKKHSYIAEFKDYDAWEQILTDSGDEGDGSWETAQRLCDETEEKWPNTKTRIVDENTGEEYY